MLYLIPLAGILFYFIPLVYVWNSFRRDYSKGGCFEHKENLPELLEVFITLCPLINLVFFGIEFSIKLDTSDFYARAASKMGKIWEKITRRFLIIFFAIKK